MFTDLLPRNGLHDTVVYSLITQQRLYMLHCSLLKDIHPEQAYHHFFFPKGCVCDVCDRSRLSPRGWVCTVFTPTAPVAPSLRPLVSSVSLIGCQLVQVYHHHLPLVGSAKSSETGQCSYISGSYSVCSLFLSFRRGPTRPQFPVTFSTV
jgi:hypothetical protein